MKKTFLLLSAMTIFTACNNDETLDVVSSQPIAFSDAFVDNSTRAAIDGSYKKDNITSFQVYGTITNASNATANIFSGTTVTKLGTTWTYTPVQYWIPDNTYNFTAIVDGNTKDESADITKVETDQTTGMPTTIKLNDASNQKDILYATVGLITATEDYNTSVGFTFSHLLAKAKFTVKNTIPTTDYTYKVSDVKITKAAKDGVYTITSASWEPKTNTYDVEFGNIVETPTETGATASAIANTQTNGLESNWERLMIPVTNATINVSFKSELYINDVLVQTKENETAQATNVTLEAGHAYNFVIELGAPGNPITFTVHELTEWDTDHDNDDTDDDETKLTEQTQQGE